MTVFMLNLLIITSWTAYGDVPVASAAEQPPQVIQDPKTKVVYYLESDRRHVAAISPSGRLLWCQELFFASDRFRICIQSIDFWHSGDYPFETGSGDDYISVKILVHAPAFGGTRGNINKKTGFFTSEPIE